MSVCIKYLFIEQTPWHTTQVELGLRQANPNSAEILAR